MAKEERLIFGGEKIPLEGLFARSEGTRGAVILHPHSLMGGDMENPVVETVGRALFAAGFSTLRFNFRGVGGSAGRFDEGRGEQDDVLAAVAFLEAQGCREILPAGYSFGAWVASGVLDRRLLMPAIFVAPPLAMFPFDLELLKDRVGLIVCGDRDPYCPAEAARSMAKALSCRLALIPGEDHFFLAREEELAESIASFFRTGERGRLSRCIEPPLSEGSVGRRCAGGPPSPRRTSARGDRGRRRCPGKSRRSSCG